MISRANADKETVLIEILLNGLDLRANAALVGSPMLSHLTNLLVMRAREELDMIAGAEAASPGEPELSEHAP